MPGDADQRPPPVDDGHGFGYDQSVASRASASGFLLDAVRKRDAGRAVLSALTIVLFVAGAGMFAYPLATDIWTEQIKQRDLADEFVAIEAEVETYDDWARSVDGQTGKALTNIVIPTIDVDMVVVEGTSPAALRAGAGHYPNTPLPGSDGNVAIAGHRTTYGKPFNRVDELRAGDDIWLLTPVGDYRYEVVDPGWDDSDVPNGVEGAPYITDPKDWSVITPTDEPALTLTSCHPKGSAAQRIVVRAALVASHPPGTHADAPAA